MPDLDMKPSHPSPVSRQRGMTLIELMVGLTLGMIVSVAALKLFADASANGKNIQRASIQIENGRYAAEMLREDLQMAGYFGEATVTGATYSTPSPCELVPSGFVASPYGLPTPVRGYSAAENLPCLANRRAGTDALVARRLDVFPIDPATLSASNTQHHVQYSFCETDPVMAPLVIDNKPSAFTLQNRACAAPNRVRAYVARTYFVAGCSRCGSGGDSTPTLKRMDLVGGRLVETALVEGVETMRLEYGLDIDNNGSADVYQTALDAAGPTSRWDNVVALKLHFIVRSPEPVLGKNLATTQEFELGGAGKVTLASDGFSRRAYTSTIRLINPSSAREAP
jgi:type IV pilus assembly protein PilW